jgi:hypothetical protein
VLEVDIVVSELVGRRDEAAQVEQAVPLVALVVGVGEVDNQIGKAMVQSKALEEGALDTSLVLGAVAEHSRPRLAYYCPWHTVKSMIETAEHQRR